MTSAGWLIIYSLYLSPSQRYVLELLGLKCVVWFYWHESIQDLILRVEFFQIRYLRYFKPCVSTVVDFAWHGSNFSRLMCLEHHLARTFAIAGFFSRELGLSETYMSKAYFVLCLHYSEFCLAQVRFFLTRASCAI